MRTLIVNSMFASSVYRRCADELGAISGVDLSMLTVKEWRMNDRPMHFDDLQVGSPYHTIVGKAWWKGYENRGFYVSGLIRAFQIAKPEVLFLLEEPFSIFAAEILAAKSLLAPRIPVVFFTWTNLSLERFDYRPSIFYRNIARLTLPRMHYALTANTDAVTVLQNFGFDKPTRVVGYGVDTTAYRTPRPERVRQLRESLQIKSSDTVIGYVGRMLEMKGVDLLIEAFSKMRSRRPEGLKLLLVGSGEAEKRLLSRAQELGMEQDVKHIASLPHQDVPDYMHALNILVLPSRRRGMWAEQFGRVLVEAMAAGKIVIGSSSGAIPEVIGDAGLIFQENNASDLTLKLENVLTLPDIERMSLLERARVRAAHYGWPRFAAEAHEAIAFCHANYSKHS